MPEPEPTQPTPKPPRISRRWRLFAEHLLRDTNASRAARAAGLKGPDANTRAWACRTRKDPVFAAYFAERLAEAEEAARLQTHRILEELALVAHSSIDDYVVDWEHERLTVREGVPPEKMRAVAGVKFRKVEVHDPRTRETETTFTAEIKLWDKNTALTNAMKHKALLVERHEHTGKDGGPIEVDAVRERIAERLARLAPPDAETKEGGA